LCDWPRRVVATGLAFRCQRGRSSRPALVRSHSRPKERAASKGPVIITDRGRPAHVLLTIEAYQKLTQRAAGIADLLAMPGVADIDFEAPRMGHIARPADLS